MLLVRVFVYEQICFFDGPFQRVDSGGTGVEGA